MSDTTRPTAEQFFKDYLPVIERIVRSRYRLPAHQRYVYEDIIQGACVGVMRVFPRIDFSRPQPQVDRLLYCYVIRFAREALRQCIYPVSVPYNLKEDKYERSWSEHPPEGHAENQDIQTVHTQNIVDRAIQVAGNKSTTGERDVRLAVASITEDYEKFKDIYTKDGVTKQAAFLGVKRGLKHLKAVA